MMSARAENGGIPICAVDPNYLHSNSTSHTWPFSAIAELVDNAYDPDVNAKQLWIDTTVINDHDCLTFIDNGEGLDYDKMHKMLSLGFSDKKTVRNHVPLGLYGNGFKSGSMRLGKDAIVFSKKKIEKNDDMCVGMLSQTYLREIEAQNVVVPIVSFKSVGDTMQPEADHDASLQAILRYSLFHTVDELISELSSINIEGSSDYKGTKIIIWNLRRTTTGSLELDFDTDRYDIRIPATEDTREHQSSPDIEFSLRAYCSILYLKPRMQINIRGQKVKTQFICKSLAHKAKDTYRPNGLRQPVRITLGYNTKNKDHYGVMMYHKNRLIKAYERVGCQKSADKKGVGVIAVIECNFIQPTHNKQNFLEVDEYRKTMRNLSVKVETYWNAVPMEDQPDCSEEETEDSGDDMALLKVCTPKEKNITKRKELMKNKACSSTSSPAQNRRVQTRSTTSTSPAPSASSSNLPAIQSVHSISTPKRKTRPSEQNVSVKRVRTRGSHVTSAQTSPARSTASDVSVPQSEAGNTTQRDSNEEDDDDDVRVIDENHGTPGAEESTLGHAEDLSEEPTSDGESAPHMEFSDHTSMSAETSRSADEMPSTSLIHTQTEHTIIKETVGNHLNEETQNSDSENQTILMIDNLETIQMFLSETERLPQNRETDEQNYQAHNQQAMQDNEKLRKERDEMMKKKESLKINENIRKERDELKKGEESLKIHENIRKERDELKKKEEESLKINENIRKERDELKKEKEEWLKIHENIRKERDELKKEKEELLKSNENIRKERDELKKKEEELLKINENIRKERDELKKKEEDSSTSDHHNDEDQDNRSDVLSRESCVRNSEYDELKKMLADMENKCSQLQKGQEELKRHFTEASTRPDDSDKKVNISLTKE